MKTVTFQKDGHKYFNANGHEVPSVSEILRHFGISQIDKVRAIQGDAVIDASSDFGTVIHDTCSLHDMDDIAECDPLVIPYLNGWKKFKEAYKPVFLVIETPMVSEVWNFAGTPDRVEVVMTIDDIKTGVVTVAEKIQTALYSILVEENLKTKVRNRRSIHLDENSFKIVPHSDASDINTAKCLLNIYNFKKQKGLL